MSFAINTNVTALNVLFNLDVNQTNLQRVSNQLSSGYKINSAADDAAGLAIATKMTNQVNGLNRGAQNAQDGLSMLQTMEGGISSVQDMLARMRELALEAANATTTTSDRQQIATEILQLQQEINRTASQTQFNTQNLLDGSLGTSGSTVLFQVGANANQTIALDASSANMYTSGATLGLDSYITNFTSGYAISDAQALVSAIDVAEQNVSNFRAQVGAVEDRLNFAINDLNTESNNLSTARSRIMDTNMAAAMTDFTKNQILVNAGISMLAQANQMPGMVLKLLG
ncbi:MAG: flagellin [Alicyclobacillus sp.]|nr:flagellin [Alicyclobacillus sp.]